MVRIAIFQSRTGIVPGANAEKVAEAIATAAEGGARILFTPEMSNVLDRDRSRAAGSIVEEDRDVVLGAACAAARRHAIWVHLGSAAVRAEDGLWANRSFLIGDDGVVCSRYDKMHLFDVSVGVEETWRESAAYRAGSTAVLANDTPLGPLGMTICYDLRFPALFARLAEAGARAIAVPAAFTVPTGRAHWEVLLRARAIEAGVFIVAAAQHGDHADGRTTYGHSLVVDPWGDVLLDMGEEEGVGFCDIDLARIAEVRAKIPALDHRRPVGEIER